MDIHIVQPGDTIHSIANRYGVSVDKLIRDNDLKDPEQLLLGQSIIISYPERIYVIQEGDNLEAIANKNNITVTELLRNNPYLVDREFIYPGEELVISHNRTQSITTHGYANAFIDNTILRKTLPYLTYLTVFNYRTSQNGEVIATADDTSILKLSIDYGVIPLMLMSTLSVSGEVDLNLTYEILVNLEVQNRLFDNILNIVRKKGYYGVNISAQFITSENQDLFYRYTKNLSNRLRQEGFITIITINPRLERVEDEVVFENIDYSNIGIVVDLVSILQYKWGTNYEPPSPVISVFNINEFLSYAIPQLEREKIYVSIPTMGYDWELPYVPDFSRASALTLESVKSLSRTYGAVINFDEISQTPYFQY